MFPDSRGADQGRRTQAGQQAGYDRPHFGSSQRPHMRFLGSTKLSDQLIKQGRVILYASNVLITLDLDRAVDHKLDLPPPAWQREVNHHGLRFVPDNAEVTSQDARWPR